jgi:hypothetical protein
MTTHGNSTLTHGTEADEAQSGGALEDDASGDHGVLGGVVRMNKKRKKKMY